MRHSLMPNLLETKKDNSILEGKQMDKNTHKRFYDKGAKELNKLNPSVKVGIHNGKSCNQKARVR